MNQDGLVKKDDNRELIAAIEAMLFIYGEPLELKKIAEILNDNGKFGKLTEEKIKEAVAEMKNHLADEGRGLTLVFASNGSDEEVQLVTKPDLSPLLENFIKDEFKESLSPASLEALALISYLGPMSRSELDYYRGVNSSFILRSLLIRGLVDRLPDPMKSNVYLYRPSFNLLKYLGISEIKELPEYEKFKGLSQNFQSGESSRI